MEKVLQYRASIYGLMALWIIIFHIQGHADVPLPFICQYINKPIRYIIGLGNVGVDVFMFLSAYCLTLSFGKYIKVMDFYKKRIIRLVIPYLLIATPFLIWKNLHSDSFNLVGFLKNFVCDLAGISFIHSGMDWTWFVFAILLLYAVFPLLYKICKKGLGISAALFIITLVLICFFYTYIPNNIVSHRFAIAYCRIPIFLIGIICAFYLNKINKEWHRPFICIILSVLLYLGIYSLSKFYPTLYENIFEGRIWLRFIPYVLPICYLCGWLFEKLPKLTLINKLGEVSLELYLIHILILNLLKHYHYCELLGGWCYLIVPFITIVISFGLHKIVK